MDAAIRPHPHNKVNLEPHRATLEKAAPDSQGETLEEAAPDRHRDPHEFMRILPQAPQADMAELTQPTPDGSNEPLRKGFSDPSPNYDADADTVDANPRRSTRIQQNTERLDESIQQQRPRKRKAEGEMVGNPAQRIRVHLAQLAIATELYSVDHEYEISG